MADNEFEGESKFSHLEDLFNRLKPKSRYISESHIDEQTSSITKQIINGDIDVRKKRGNLDLPQEKNDFEDMLKRKFIQQFAKEKEQLQHRLGYVENSLVHLNRFDYLKRRGSVDGNLSASRKSEEWRKEHEEQMKKLEQKKKELAQRSKQKETQMEALKAKIQEEENAKKKSQLLQSIKKVKERTEKRQQVAKQQKEKLKELLSRKELYQKMEQKYQEKEESVLQERKKKLAQIRQLKPHINLQEIIEHEQKVLQILKEKQAMRSRQIRMNSSRASSYKPSYQSVYYKQLATPQEEQAEENPKHKLEKMRQFSEQVKSKYVPDIDENKRREMEQRLQRQNKSKIQREEKQRQLLQKPKIKGLQYLQMVKNMPKKQNKTPPTGPKTDRIAYKNYLGSVSVDMGKTKPWTTLLSKGENKVETAELLRYESEKIQEKLKMKEVHDRVMKIKDDGSIDQEYYEMVKAKLSLLAKE